MSDLRIRDLIGRLLPPWLVARLQSGRTAGYRFVWGAVAGLDALLDVAAQGLVARFPGKGTPTALALIGRSRGIMRWQDETAEAYGVRLQSWLETWSNAGADFALLEQVHGYLQSKPVVRLYRRTDGACTTIASDGTITRVATTAWDWDSVSHPERNDPIAPWWSDMWLVVYVSSQWPVRTGTIGDLVGDDGFALGHMASHEETDAIKGLIGQWKAAHSRVRAVIWTTDPLLFVPTDAASMPDGTWGAWSRNVAGSQVVSTRNTTSCRYWEPR